MGYWVRVGFGLNKTLENLPFTTICKLSLPSTMAITVVVGNKSRLLLLHAGRIVEFLDLLNRYNGAFIPN